MSNKKTIPTISSSEASKMSVSALAVRPNDASRFGQGGLSAKALQEWFDKLPNLVKEKFNEIAQTLASSEAAKYIGTDALGVDNLYDFLLLFGPRGTGVNDKNISDYIETLYAPLGESTEKSVALKDIVSDIARRLVDASAGHVVDAHLDSVTNTLVITFADGTDARVDLSPLAADVGVQGEIDRLKETDADFERRLSNIEEHISDDYFVTDNSVAYEKAVPARACSSAKLLSLGGMTYRDEETNTLRDSKVTEIKSHGANLADIYGFSADAMNTPSANRNLSNPHGTTISTTDASNSVVVSQSAYNPNEYVGSYENGYFCIGINQDFAEGEKFTFSFDVKVSNNLSDNNKMLILPNGRGGVYGEIVDGRFVGQAEWTNLQNRKFIEIRNMGKSATFSNFTLERGHTDGKYKPMREPIVYTIPAEIQAINKGKGVEGYADTIDFESRKSIEKVKTLVFDGKETWYVSGADTGKGQRVCVKIQQKAVLAETSKKSYCVSNLYDTESLEATYRGNEGVSADANNIRIYDSQYNTEDVTLWKSHLAELYANGNPLTVTYALAEPIETDIYAELEGFDNIIEVEGGGSLEFVNEYKNPVPSAVKYLLKEESAV